MKYLVLSFICCLLDLFSKHKINKVLGCNCKREILAGKLYFINTKNTGIAYNRLENKPKAVKIITSLITGVFGICFFKLINEKNTSELLKFGSALALGGAMGNLIDRIKNGCVTDFIYFKTVRKSPIFNIADFFIFIGALFIAFGDLFKR